MLNDTFPLRVEAIPAAHASEWRADDSLRPARRRPENGLVRSGTIEERCDARHVLLRAGGLLFHQPGRSCYDHRRRGPARDAAHRLLLHRRGHGPFPAARMLHTEPAEQHDLNWLANAANDFVRRRPVPGGRPVLKEELPFGAMQQFIIHLENLLILLARRCRRTTSAPWLRSGGRRQNALVEDARAYFAENLAHERKIVDDICTALAARGPSCSRRSRARLHRTAMEGISAMRIEYAAQLLARGASPGEVAAQMSCFPARISARNSALPRGNTAVRLPPHSAGTCARRQNRQTKKAKSGNQKLLLQKPAERVEYHKQREASRSVCSTISYQHKGDDCYGAILVSGGPGSSAATPVWNFLATGYNIGQPITTQLLPEALSPRQEDCRQGLPVCRGRHDRQGLRGEGYLCRD